MRDDRKRDERTPVSEPTPKNLAGFIWQVADLLRGDDKRADYGKIILPCPVLRRLECVLEPTRDTVLATKARWDAKNMDPAPPGIRSAQYGRIST
jgi:type I restriction enzyme M protein